MSNGLLSFTLLSLALMGGCQAWWWSASPEWDGLKAGFGLGFGAFNKIPRTLAEATSWGWTKDTTVGCDVSGTKFNGDRYMKNGDTSKMVLFDKNGYVAGLQAGIPKTQTYPREQNKKYHVFNEEPNMWVITAYFTNPATICTQGRSESQFETEGTGTMLAVQNGPTAASLMVMPMEENQVIPTTNFIAGECFIWMGNHYWYDVSSTMSCDDTFPVFLMYNNGKLNAFGWAFNPNFENSDAWEHPSASVFGSFIKNPPACLGADGPVTTLHVYLTNSPRSNYC